MSVSSVMAFFDPFGTSPGSSLNWSQHAALEARSAPSGAVAFDTSAVVRELRTLGFAAQEIVASIGSLERSVGLRLDAQTEQLREQATLLAEIAQTLQSPSATRSAERVRDASQLLARHRYERALTTAEEAIEANPNSHAAFTAAGWANLGLGRPEQAREQFREAAQATAEASYEEDYPHVQSVLQAARLTFALDGADAALRELDARRTARPRAEERLLELSLQGQIAYDRAVYLFASGSEFAAVMSLQVAAGADMRCALMALTDPVLAESAAIHEAATDGLQLRDDALQTLLAAVEQATSAFAAWCEALDQFDGTRYPNVAGFIYPDASAWDTQGRRLGVLNPWSPELLHAAEEKWLVAGFDHLGIDEYVDHDAWLAFNDAAGHTLRREEVLAHALAPALRRKDIRMVDKGLGSAVIGFLKGQRVQLWSYSVNEDGQVSQSNYDEPGTKRWYACGVDGDDYVFPSQPRGNSRRVPIAPYRRYW